MHVETVSPELAFAFVSMLFNIGLTFITTRMKLQVSELKVLLYEKFVTKDDLLKLLVK